jgi:hypothetical protein
MWHIHPLLLAQVAKDHHERLIRQSARARLVRQLRRAWVRQRKPDS